MRYHVVQVLAIFIVGTLATIGTDSQDTDVATVLENQGYEVTPLMLEGSLSPEGEIMSFNGSVQEIERQIRHIKPDFSWSEFRPAHRGEGPSKDVGQTRAAARGIETLCHVQNLPPGPRDSLRAAHDWLYPLNTYLSASAQTCQRIWCQQGAAVWLCNDNLGWKEYHSLDIATLMDHIIFKKECRVSPESDLIQGQAFSTGYHYNVLFAGHPPCAA